MCTLHTYTLHIYTGQMFDQKFVGWPSQRVPNYLKCGQLEAVKWSTQISTFLQRPSVTGGFPYVHNKKLSLLQ